MSFLPGRTIEDYRALYESGKAGPTEVIRACIDEIDSKDPIIKAFLHVCRDKAIEDAAALETAGQSSLPLYGVPVAIKDNICTRGIPTSCASRILAGYVPPYDATVVSRLKSAGAVIVGKTNLDEFAMGSSTENSAFFPTRNPWNEDCSPGGSSGGSAAAVAAGIVPIALGSDTGGSIRQPASFCGTVGLKGTYGTVSRYGLVAFASSLDHIGPITGSVRDAASVMRIIAGADPLDSTSIRSDVDGFLEGIDGGTGGLRFAFPAGLGDWNLHDTVRGACFGMIERLRSDGMVVEETAFPDMEASIAAYYVIANAEASSNLARYDGVRFGARSPADSIDEMYTRTRGEGFGDEVKRRILLGTYVLSSGYYDEYYIKALKLRESMKRRFIEIFGACDIIILPTTPDPPFELGERTDDPVSMYLSDIFTTPASIAGLPAISIPAALTDEGLPVGLQLIAAPGRERELLRAATAIEEMLGFADMIPEAD